MSVLYVQMAYELHGLLAGNVSIVTGENIKPSYGGDDESFLRKVITPIYRVIQMVISLQRCSLLSDWHFFYIVYYELLVLMIIQEAMKSENGKAAHKAWSNYDDLNEYFWYAI